MAISSVSSNISSQVSNIKPSAPPVRAERENDGDKDDGSASKVSAAKPTVNTSGETIGANVNVKA